MESGGKKMENELEKSERQIELCGVLDKVTNELRERYGLPPFNFPIENIHFFKKLAVQNSEVGGVSLPESQSILVADDQSAINLARNICHELIHLKSHGAIKYQPANQTLDHEYRHGLILRSKDGEKHYFRVFEEALTEMLTKEIIERLKTEGFFGDETARMNEILESYKNRTDYPHRDKLYSGNLLAVRDVIPDDNLPPDKEIKGYMYGYESYRESFGMLVDKLFERSNGRFNDRQDIVDLFVRAKLKGSMLATGRLVDEIFGVGTFRKIGELTTTKNDVEFRQFVEKI